MINVLNSKSREELEEINIPDRIATILEIKKIKENIKGLHKEKKLAQLAMIPVTTVPIVVVGIKPSSSSKTIEYTSTTGD